MKTETTSKYLSKAILVACLASSTVYAADVKQSALATKNTPVTGDKALIIDSADGNKSKNVTLGSLPLSTATQTLLDLKSNISCFASEAAFNACFTLDWLSVDASGFNGNLATTDDTLQEIAQKVDDLVLGSGSMTWPSSDGSYYGVRNGAWINLGSVFAVAPGSDDNYVTDAEKTKISNLSGTNTGDQDLSSYLSKTNTTSFTPSGDYHPATKKYVDDSITAGGGYTDEQAQDAAGGMFSGNTETGITVTYNDTTGKVDFVVATTLASFTDDSTHRFVTDTEKTTWNAKQNALVAGTDYLTPNGSAANLTSFPTLNQNTTGSAATLTTARTIGGVSFNGSANINLPGVNASGTQNTSGNAGTATSLAANGGNCSAGQAALGVDASGAAEGCWTPSGSFNPASPGAIGVTTPAAGTFTSVTAATYASSAADGSRYSTLPNNTSAPSAASVINGFYTYNNELYGVENSATASKVLMAGDVGSSVQAHDADLTTWAGVTPGTGVANALGNAVGGTSGLVTYSGAMGTPASVTLTNATGLPLSGVVDSTTEALGAGSIELGHASDTTLARTSAGVITVEGVTVITTSNSVTLTNKSLTAVEVDGSAAGVLTAAQVSGTIVHNRGMGAADVALTLPTAAAGYNALFTVGTAQSNKWGVRANTTDKIYLLAADGTIAAGSDNGYARMTAAQVGQAFACWTFQTGSSAWDWQCKAGAIGTSTFAAN